MGDDLTVYNALGNRLRAQGKKLLTLLYVDTEQSEMRLSVFVQ